METYRNHVPQGDSRADILDSAAVTPPLTSAHHYSAGSISWGSHYSQIYFPTYSNRLKEVARHLGFQWSHPAASGLQSLSGDNNGRNEDTSIKQVLITYNREDCEALEVVTRAVERVAVFA
jgi:hypothetical protein